MPKIRVPLAETEHLISTEFPIRYHHLEGFWHLVTKWYGLDAWDVHRVRKNGGQYDHLQYKQVPPWELPKTPESVRRLKLFCLDQTKLRIESWIHLYQEKAHSREKIMALDTLFSSEDFGLWQPYLDRALSSLQAVFSANGENIKLTPSLGELSRSGLSLLWQSVHSPQAISRFQEEFSQKELSFSPHLKELSSILLTSPYQEKLQEGIRLIGELFEPMGLLYGEEEVLFDSLDNSQTFLESLKAYLREVEHTLLYYEDILGPNPSFDSQHTKAALNKFFLTYYRFFMTAMFSPQENISLTLEPDLICLSCRGGESTTGYHCIKKQDSTELNEDHLTREALQNLITSKEKSVKNKAIGIITDEKGTAKEIRVPVSALFDVEFMDTLDQYKTEVYRKLF